MVEQRAPVLFIEVEHVEEGREERLEVLAVGLVSSYTGLEGASRLRNQAFSVHLEDPGGGFCPKILVADVKICLLDLGFVLATRTMQFLYRLGHLGALFAAPVNRNADPEAQHVVVPKLLGSVLPHILHVEIGV